MRGLNVVPSDERDLFVRGDEDSLVVPQDMTNHGGPPIGEGTSLTNEGEVGRVGNAVGVYTTVHLIAVEIR